MTDQQRRELEAQQKALGDKGENYVLALERRRLAAHPRLAEVRISGRYDLGLGYDITSYESVDSNTHKYIEVKTYSGQPHFFLSEGERAAARKYGACYYIYLVDVNRMNAPDYEPLIIRDPLTKLNGDEWQMSVKQSEYTFVGDTAYDVPGDFDMSVVMMGCYNDNIHHSWILDKQCYNVRANINGSAINGGVTVDEVTEHARYLVLYNVQSPKMYKVYSIDRSRVVDNMQMRKYGYRNPHSRYYLLYHMEKEVSLPRIDVMGILRANNDKVQRTSGTPVYMLGERLRRYFVEMSMHGGNSAPRRGFSNEGKPWTEVQRMKIADWIAEGKDVAYIAMKLYRSVEEIKAMIAMLSPQK